MPETSFSDQVRGLVLDIAWSLWAELGVSGWLRRHKKTAVDLEALLIATATLARDDARLRDETLDWCVTKHRLVSAVRLRNWLRTAEPDFQAAFGDFSMTVKQHARVPWPGDGQPYPFAPTGRSAALGLHRPALIQLRLRAIVGVSVRAEILRLTLAEPARLFSVAELASAAAHGKGNTAAALDLLAMAGVVESQVTANQFRYRLARTPQLRSLLEPLPLHFPDWHARFRVIRAILHFADAAAPAGMPRAVDARRAIRSVEPDLRRLGSGRPLPSAGGEALAADFEQWSLALLRSWTGDEADQAMVYEPQLRNQ
jgi:hypothetical protein